MKYTLIKIKPNYYRIVWIADTINGSRRFGYEFSMNSTELDKYLANVKKSNPQSIITIIE